MKAVLSLTVLLATFVSGVVVGVYLPLAVTHPKSSESPAGTVYGPADPDGERDHQEMLRMLRLMQQEMADLRTTTSRVARLCDEVLRQSQTANGVGADQIALDVDEIRRRLDDAQRDREAAEAWRHQRAQQAEVDALYRRLIGRAHDHEPPR